MPATRRARRNPNSNYETSVVVLDNSSKVSSSANSARANVALSTNEAPKKLPPKEYGAKSLPSTRSSNASVSLRQNKSFQNDVQSGTPIELLQEKYGHHEPGYVAREFKETVYYQKMAGLSIS